jgi:hypothetical protein
MAEELPELYALLAEFYNLDLAARSPAPGQRGLDSV